MERILIIDFGSQYTQLIAKKLRKQNVYTEIAVYNNMPKSLSKIRGVILSGSPHSVIDGKYPSVELKYFIIMNIPILGICYGAQVLAKKFGETVSNKEVNKREFGKHKIIIERKLLGIQAYSCDVWMSHNDTILTCKNIEILARTTNKTIAAFKVCGKPIYGLQFHPEVSHTELGTEMLREYVKLCNIENSYCISEYKVKLIKNIKKIIGNEQVIVAVSGGIDSTVTACLLHEAIGKQLLCVFVNNGLLRKNEIDDVERIFKEIGLCGTTVDATDTFYENLKDVSDPEQKRKIIGRTFIQTFKDYIKLISQDTEIKWLAQGTIYPDVIESVPGFGLIKSHHNVGGLPEHMDFKLIEPLRDLFKDEVRELGKEIGIPYEIINRHPFPGPGLAIRIMGEVTKEKVEILQEADAVFINELRENKLYHQIWQAGVILLSTKTVGVMGDRRTYEYVAALRAICSENGMTAKPYHFNMEFLEEVGTKIINKVRGINRVVYDVSSKPPATIEWE